MAICIVANKSAVTLTYVKVCTVYSDGVLAINNTHFTFCSIALRIFQINVVEDVDSTCCCTICLQTIELVIANSNELHVICCEVWSTQGEC